MACKDCHMSLKVLIDLPGYKAGKIIKVEARDGVPVLKYWRDRLRDAEIDGCVEIVKVKPKPTTPVKEKEGDK